MRKQKDGRYRAKVTIGVDGLGKTITKYVSGRTKRELEQAKADVREKYIAGIDEKAQTIMALDWILIFFNFFAQKKRPFGLRYFGLLSTSGSPATEVSNDSMPANNAAEPTTAQLTSDSIADVPIVAIAV